MARPDVGSVSALGPERPSTVRAEPYIKLRTGLSKPRTRSTARSRQAVPLAGAGMERSALRADSPPLLTLRAHGKTRCVRCAHCAQTVAVSQSTKRAARAALKPALLGAP